MRNILYTPGSHGNFLKYLFDSYEQKHLLPSPITSSGNTHNQPHVPGSTFKYSFQSNIAAYEVCTVRNYAEFIKNSDTNYIIVWEGFEEFCYIYQCYFDRAGGKDNIGIKQLEQNVFDYENNYGYPVSITNILKEHFNFYGNTQPVSYTHLTLPTNREV